MGVLRFGPCAGAAPGQSHPDDFGHSSFATVRHRTVRSKGCLSNKTALAMIFKLAEAAEKSWRRLDGHNQIPSVNLTPRIIFGNLRSSNCKLNPLPPDSFRHQDSAIAPTLPLPSTRACIQLRRIVTA